MKAAALIILFFASSAAAAPTTAPAKLWASDLSQYLNKHPGQWIVAQSEKPALSADEAEAQARHQAAESIAKLIAPRIAGGVAVSAVEASLLRDGWIIDRQIEANERPYGTIWSAAILVDASPQKLDALTRQLDRQTHQKNARLVACVFALMIFSAIVGCVYMFLNWLTRGFFRGRLAIASFLVVADALFGVVHLL